MIKDNYRKLGYRLFDPCNNGNITHAIPKQNGWGIEYKVFVDNIAISDIERFKKTNYIPYNVNIITMPPEKNRVEIIKKCIESARRIAAIYMPFKYLFIKDTEMEEVFRYREPARVYAYYPKRKQSKNEDYINIYQESEDIYALFVWDNVHRFRNRTTIHWI